MPLQAATPEPPPAPAPAAATTDTVPAPDANARYLVQIAGKWGYIDAAGTLKIPATLERAQPFSEGLARIGAGDKVGYIDISGQVVIPPRFDMARDFHEGVAVVGVLEMPDTSAAPLPEEFRLDSDNQVLKWGVIDRTGAWVIQPRFDAFGDFANGLAPARSVTLNDGYGYVDHAGVFKILPAFRDAKSFVNGFARVQTNRGATFIDASGNIVSTTGFDTTGDFSEGLAVASRGALVAEAESMAGQLFSPSADEQDMDRKKRTLAVGNEGNDAEFVSEIGQGYINPKGDFVIPPHFDSAHAFHHSLARVNIGGKYGYIDPTGALKIPAEYGDALDFSEGLAAVRQKGGWIYIDTAGKRAFNVRFDKAASFREGLALVTLFETVMYIDRTGRQVWPPE